MLKISPILVALAAAIASVSADTKIPEGGTTIFSESQLFTMNFLNKEPGFAVLTKVPVEGSSFAEAVRVATEKQPLKYYHIALKNEIDAPLKKGSAMLLVLSARSVAGGHNDTGLGEVNFIMQGKLTPPDIAKFDFTPGAEWQQYFFPFSCPADLPPKNSNIALCFGAMLQTIEIGGLQLIDFGTSVKVSDLPRTEITYAGREPDAAWRRLAAERIEKHRKADLTVLVSDSKGKPVPGAEVKVEMKRHAFLFGAAITGRAFEDSEITRPLLENHKKLFNQGLPIQSFVWSIFDSPEGEVEADKFMKYFEDNNISARGHTLLWERLNVMPPDVRQMIKNKDAEKLRQRISDHIRNTVTKYKGRMDEWVVENEAVDNREVRNLLGDASIAEWFKIARESDPGAKLMINENRVEGLKPDKSDRLLELCKLITDNGGTFDIIGIQGHFGTVPVPIETALQQFDKLAATGKELAITEYDFNSEEAQLKSDYTRDFLTAVFSHPSFTSFTMWRFWDGKPSFHESVIFANDWSVRPSGKVYEDLVFKEWWTNAKGETDAQGRFTSKGFLGDYEVTATLDGKKVSVPFSLVRDGENSVSLVLP